MAKKKKADAPDGDDQAEKGGKLKLIIGAVVLVVVGAVLGGKVLGGGGETPASAMGPTTTTTEAPGPVTTLDAITLNLADGRFLKLGLAFEVHADDEYPPPSDVEDTITKGFARELDVVITTLSTYTYEDLVAPNGKQEAKRALLEELVEVSDGAIKDVLFHEFVMQ